MITTALREHLDGIRALWQQAFGNSTQYIDLFLEQGVQPHNALVYLQDGRVAGMLFILPCSLVFRESSYQCAYFYGIATRTELRGRGISTELLEYAYHLCSKRGYAVCALVPATSSLFRFYAKRGYDVQGAVKTLSVRSAELGTGSSSAVLSPINMHDVFDMRKNCFGTAYLEWDNRTLAYIQAENRHCGGSFYRYNADGACGYLCCVPRDDTLLVTEYSGQNILLPNLLECLHRIYHKQNYLIRLAPDTIMGELTPFAMTRWIANGTREFFYLSLALD